MKAITVRQPHASLIAAGVKTIETRPRACSYRGRIAIHAAKTWNRQAFADLAHVLAVGGRNGPELRYRHPVGAVVASAVLTDCVQIIDLDGVPGIRSDEAVRIARARGRFDYADQLPLGDFSPGRYALLLDDIAPTTERCPWCWGETIWPEVCEVCGRAGKCDPVPARGQQAVPWEWTP